MSIFIVNEYLLVFKIIYCFIINIVDRVGVVQGIWRGFLPAKKVLKKFYMNQLGS